MNQYKISFLFIVLLAMGTTSVVGQETNNPITKRFVAIDNVCAWPNLTLLRDGTIIATIFNQPSHARAEGDVECWSSRDGEFWKKCATVTAHDAMANRMNVGVGLTQQGGLVVLASGWSLKKEDDKMTLGKVLPLWACWSKDGTAWEVNKDGSPPAEDGSANLIPFGDISPAEDGSLRGAVYASNLKGGGCRVWMARSDDAGKTWKLHSLVADNYNETTVFPLPNHGWLAAARHDGSKMGVDLFSSQDDGKTWQLAPRITQDNEGPADLTRLADGRLMLACGNRNKGSFGVDVRFSSDNGVTWSQPQALIDDLLSPDCGYPSSVQRADGAIVTAYYAHAAPDHERYHMGVIIWYPTNTEKLRSSLNTQGVEAGFPR